MAAFNPGDDNRERVSPGKRNFILKVTMDLVHPPIWRRILVPADIKLSRLHTVIQIVTGATDSIQHFFIDSQRTIYANPAWEDLPKIKSGRDVGLATILSRPGDRLAYYCGDDDEWEHTVELLKITEVVSRSDRAACLAGDQACLRRDARHRGKFLLSAVNRALQRLRV